MVRAKYTSCALAALAWTGMGWAQPPTQESAGDPVVTVQEMGKPKHQCVILSTTIQPDGSRTYEVQCLDNGQRMTISEPAPGQGLDPRGAQNAHGLFHDATVPAGDNSAPTTNAFSPKSAATASVSPSAFTPLPPNVPSHIAAFSSGPQGANAFVPGQTPQATPPANFALPTLPEMDNAPPAEVVTPVPAAAPTATTPMPSAPMQPATTTGVTPVQATVPMTAPAPAVQTTVPAAPLAQTAPSTLPGIQSLPQADGSRPDPLMSLETYTSWPPKKKNDTNTATAPETPKAPATSSAPLNQPAVDSSKTPTTQTSAQAKPEITKIETVKVETVKVETTKVEATKAEAAKAENANQEQFAPGLGSGSVLAAGSGFVGPSSFIPSPMASMPSTPPPGPPMPVPQPNNFYMQPQGPAPSGVLPNAFTSGTDAKIDTASSGGAFHSANWYRMRELASGGAFPNNQAVAYRNNAQAQQYAAQQQALAQASYQQNTATPELSLDMLTTTLREALLPSVRETAAEQLGVVDCRSNPQVVDTLVTSARHDPCPAVRSACVRTLVKLQVNNVTLRLALDELKNDKDASVRHEATEALRTVSWQTTGR